MSPGERLILESYKTSLEGLAAYLGDAFEFVLHDLEDLDHSVVKILNGVRSGRREGAPITDLALSMLEKISAGDGGPYITYHSRNKYGKPVKALTTAIFGEKKRIIGLLCVNFYYDTPLISLLEHFFPRGQGDFVSENFINDSDELIRIALEKAKREAGADASVPSSQKNKEIVTILFHQGIYKLKNAVTLTAEDLGITKNTVYLHLRALEGGGRVQ